MATFNELVKAQAAIADEIARKAALPPEPNVDDQGNAVAWFRKQYRKGEIFYTYAAVYVPAINLWYVSGTRSRFATGAKWEDLVEWITDCAAWELWECSAYEIIATSAD